MSRVDEVSKGPPITGLGHSLHRGKLSDLCHDAATAGKEVNKNTETQYFILKLPCSKFQ
jgi:hypothetical protein